MACNVLDGNLASLLTRKENAFVSSLVADTTDLKAVWVGGFLGMPPLDGITWTDGEEARNYVQPWLAGEPSNNDNADACLQLQAQTNSGERIGEWDARSCNSLRAYGT